MSDPEGRKVLEAGAELLKINKDNLGLHRRERPRLRQLPRLLQEDARQSSQLDRAGQRRALTMKALRFLNIWAKWGLIPRLMAAVGFASLVGGGIQNYLLVLEGAAEHSARHEREVHETLKFLAPLVADQAVLGDYAAINQLLNGQAKKLEINELTWTDKNGRKLVGKDDPDRLEAPRWFTARRADRARRSDARSRGRRRELRQRCTAR